MPSGMASNRYPLDKVSPTVSSGVISTPALTGASIADCAVVKPGLWSSSRPSARATAGMITVVATSALAKIFVRRFMTTPQR